MVREGMETSSTELPERISTGATVEELDLVGDRLHYRRQSGTGPDEGWISISIKGKPLAQRFAPATPRATGLSKYQGAAPQAPAKPPVEEVPRELRLQAETKMVPWQELEQPENLTKLLATIDHLDNLTALKLQTQYSQLGFAISEHDFVSRVELVHRMRDALVWKELKLPSLAKVCKQRGLDVDEDQPREEMLQLLADSTWENLGIPITRLPDAATARVVLNDVRSLESIGPNMLVSQCRNLGLPSGGPPEVLVAQLKQAIIWKGLPAAELFRECKAHGISPDVSDLSDEAGREELFKRLVTSVRGNRWEARGISAQLLGNQTLAAELLEQVDRIQAMGPLSLKLEYKKMGLPFDPQMDTQASVDRLRDALIWQSLPLTALQEECRQRGLVHTDGRKAMLLRLHQRLGHELELERKGLPVRKLGGYEAAMELMEQHEEIEQMSFGELCEWYKGTGFPEEDRIESNELLELLQQMATWEALPLAELKQECLQRKVPIRDLGLTGSEEAQRGILTDKLLQQDRMETWNQHGFQAHRIDNFQAVLAVVQRYSEYERMGNEDLENAYIGEGLPRGAEMDRSDLCATLKTVLIWESMPLLELQMDGLEHDPPIRAQNATDNDNEQRTALIQQLTVKLLQSSYEEQGIPVAQIGLLKAYQVGKQLLSFDIMSHQELLAACTSFGLPADPDLSVPELVMRLRDVALWNALPADDLWAECKKRGIQEELRGKVLEHLLRSAY